MKSAYLDANVVIYYIEQHPRYLKAIQQMMFGPTGQDQIQCTVSDLVRMESRVHPIAHGNNPLLARYDQFFEANPTRRIPFDRSVFDLATALRAQHRIKTPDALHLAAAIIAGCDQFWTNDDRLNRAAQGRIQTIIFGDA